MPEEIDIVRQYPVTLELLDGDNVRLVWDGMDEVVPAALIFSSSVDDEDLIHSLRCLLAIEGKRDPTAQSVLDAITRRGGLQTAARSVYVSSIVQNHDGNSIYISYGYTSADSSFGLNIPLDELQQRPKSAKLLASQIGARLRFKRLEEMRSGRSPIPYESLTPEAISWAQQFNYRGF